MPNIVIQSVFVSVVCFVEGISLETNPFKFCCHFIPTFFNTPFLKAAVHSKALGINNWIILLYESKIPFQVVFQFRSQDFGTPSLKRKFGFVFICIVLFPFQHAFTQDFLFLHGQILTFPENYNSGKPLLHRVLHNTRITFQLNVFLTALFRPQNN